MFKVGDIVTPRETCIGNGYYFKITEIELQPFDDNLYKLRRVEQQMSPINGPIDYQLREISEVENSFWKATELYLKTDFKTEFINIEGDDNMKNILDVYKERTEKAIQEKYNDLIKSIKESDEIQEIMQDTNRLIQETNPSRKFPEVVLNVYTDKTKEDIEKAERERNLEVKALYDLIEEIEAYFAMTSDFSERMQILRSHNIIDKRGKLII